MTTIKFTGHWTGEHSENQAMGLVPGKRYAIVQYHKCCGCQNDCACADTDGCPDDGLLPVVRNERGELQSLVHGEYLKD